MAANLTRSKLDYSKKLHQDYDVTLSKINARENAIKSSVLGYAGRMRSNKWAEPKQENYDSLVIHAKHIPKFPTVQSNRRPASLDELLGKHAPLVPRNKPRSASKISLPALPERLSKRTHHVKISFVSASDLYDIVDFSIRNKDTKQEANSLKQDEVKLAKNSQKERHSPREHEALTNATISQDDKQSDKTGLFIVSVAKEGSKPKPPTKHRNAEEDESKKCNDGTANEQNHEKTNNELNLNSLMLENLKSRPSRAKRMQLRQPLLNIIPENDVIAQRSSSAVSDKKEVVSPPPKPSPRTYNAHSNLTAIPEYDMTSSIEKLLEKKRLNKRPEASKLLRTGGVAKLEPLHGENNTEPHTQLKTKMKAQRKFKRLIYLRDMPEKHYQRS